ncbi:histidine--tRNA ligase [Candidatus Saccharibacteria bacterium]|nr:histidine--tRNA ligase [Candidatus Saccharibacteria bacterium]
MSLNLSSYKGTRDIYPEDMRLRRYIFDTWARVAESFGYEEYDSPLLEPLELYAAKSGEEIVNDQTYKFTDRGERTVAIRPEMTPSIARMVAARRQELALPARLYSISNYMRYERPQNGREREFWQLNTDIFGAAGIDADAEIILLGERIMRAFGATDNMFTIRISDRQWIDFVMRSYLGLDEEKAGRMIKLFDRFTKMPREDFDASAAEIFGEEKAAEGLEKINKLLVDNINDLPNEVRDKEFEQICTVLDILQKRGVTNAVFDPTLMRGFDYYTGIVFEFFDNSPENNRSLFGGGRYDGLVGLFGVEDMPVVGVAPGELTTALFLRSWNLVPELKPATDVVLIPLGDVKVKKVADELRAAGVNVAVDFTDRKVEKKIKAAVKAGVYYVLFIGEDEIKSGEFTLKNLTTQEEKKLSVQEISKMIIH